jgi:hypothetical protein
MQITDEMVKAGARAMCWHQETRSRASHECDSVGCKCAGPQDCDCWNNPADLGDVRAALTAAVAAS